MADAQQEKRTTIQLEADWESTPPVTFTNFVHITQTGDDFVLFFGDFVGTPQALDGAQKTGRAAVPLKLAVRLPPGIVLATLTSLTRAWNSYVETLSAGAQGLHKLDRRGTKPAGMDQRPLEVPGDPWKYPKGYGGRPECNRYSRAGP